MKNHLELFSGTHSFGKITHKKGYKIYSLDLQYGAECPLKSNYKSQNHYKINIFDFDYKQFKPGFFDLITASPPCRLWSNLRNCWIGRKLKGYDGIFTREQLYKDIDEKGKPLVDKVREIINYFNPKYYLIENPQTGKMKTYITDLPFYDVDYCKYSDWGYRKKTRLWTNIENFKPKICKRDCENMNEEKKKHKKECSKGFTLLERYRIPPKLIEDIFKDI